jgi:hypothetical protein
MNGILENIEWVKGSVARTTARRATFATIGEALKFGARHADRGRSVAYTSEILTVRAQGPIQQEGHRKGAIPTGPRVRRFVVTVRPTAEWEKHAQEQKGYGVDGKDRSRPPTPAEKRAAEVRLAKRNRA